MSPTGTTSGMSHVTPKKRPETITPRAYHKRIDLCRLWSLVCRGKTQTEIAQEMGKDPAWVSRSIKEINADFSKAFTTQEESRLISERLLKLQNLYLEAMDTAYASSGHVRISALRLASEILHQEASFEMAVGLVRKVPNDVRLAGVIGVAGNQPNLELLRGEFQDGDLDQILLELADSIRERQSEAAIEA